MYNSVTFKLCNFVHNNIIKIFDKFLTFRLTLSGLEQYRQKQCKFLN